MGEHVRTKNPRKLLDWIRIDGTAGRNEYWGALEEIKDGIQRLKKVIPSRELMPLRLDQTKLQSVFDRYITHLDHFAEHTMNYSNRWQQADAFAASLLKDIVQETEIPNKSKHLELLATHAEKLPYSERYLQPSKINKPLAAEPAAKKPGISQLLRNSEGQISKSRLAILGTGAVAMGAWLLGSGKNSPQKATATNWQDHERQRQLAHNEPKSL